MKKQTKKEDLICQDCRKIAVFAAGKICPNCQKLRVSKAWKVKT